jgi:hypothetical protein
VAQPLASSRFSTNVVCFVVGDSTVEKPMRRGSLHPQEDSVMALTQAQTAVLTAIGNGQFTPAEGNALLSLPKLTTAMVGDALLAKSKAQPVAQPTPAVANGGSYDGVLGGSIPAVSIPARTSPAVRPTVVSKPAAMGNGFVPNANPKTGLGDGITAAVSDKTGAVCLYGMGRLPVTLYVGQLERILAQADALRAWIAANNAYLSRK